MKTLIATQYEGNFFRLIKRYFLYYSPLIVAALLMFFVLSVSRVLLIIWQNQRTFINYDWWHVFINGIRIDISTICYLLFIPFLLILLSLALPKILRQNICKVINVFMVLAVVLLAFFEVITPTFILEYDLRPNRLFVEYLIYPKEVFSMLISGYKVEMVISFLVVLLSGYFANLVFKSSFVELFNDKQTTVFTLKFWLISIVLLLALFLGARGTLGHRPINPALVAFSNDHLLNELSLNSIYSTAFALKQMRLEQGSDQFYGKMPTEEMLATVLENTLLPIEQYKNVNYPTSAYHQASYQGKPKNIVILLQESLGARYVGALGGSPLSPYLDNLMAEGWNFTNLYATGTRSVRGIEAVITGFTPTTSRSVVKLPKSQQNFFTIASFLQSHRYHTQFIYGGESHFDNMKSFFLGNGFTDIVDLPKFDRVDFEGSWGASDEDLYRQAHQEFEKLAQKQQPFFSLVFTSSNHSPYQFPDNKITLYDQEKNTRNNAAKYADYALGQFFQQAKKSDYWHNTIFVVIADHDSRVAGASLVPVSHFHIPALIIGQDIPIKQDNQLASQIDIAPTVLSLAGINGEYPMIGHDLTYPISRDKQRAMMQYDKNFLYMTPDDKVFLQPHKPALIERSSQTKITDKQLIARAKAHALLGSYLYNNLKYQ